MQLIKRLNKKLAHLVNFNNLNISFAHEGEDILVERILAKADSGFYVDIGAYHPIRYSNTYKFYLKGWQGINVDAMPGSMALFKKKRPRDLNLEIPVADVATVLTYHIFNEQALNTLSAEEAQKKDGLRGYKLLRKEELRTQRLDEILDQYLPENKKIDFMSIDVEGYDLKVLKSNNWQKYRPTLLLTENLESFNDVEKALTSEMALFMRSINYKLLAKTCNTLFFLDEQHLIR